MTKQRGFTLIELIIVIIILGILAVTAAPRFFNFADDARKAALEGLEGSINSANSLVYGKAVIAGQQSSVTEVTVDGVETIYGYATAGDDGIPFALDLSGSWVSFVETGDTSRVFAQGDFADAAAVVAGGCFLRYNQATGTSAATRPTVEVDCD